MGFQGEGDWARFSNLGTLVAGSYGIFAEGDHLFLHNDGLIDSGFRGLSATREFAHLSNTGTIVAATGMLSFGLNARIVNSGVIEATNSRGESFAAGIQMNVSNGGQIVNSGSIVSTAYYGVVLNIFTATDAQNSLRNSGEISGDRAGVFLQFTPVPTSAAAFSVVNSGLISGGDAGISVEKVRLIVNNTATGQIIAASGDAITVTGVLNLINRGEIAASGAGGEAIVLGAGSELSSMTNYGTITSARSYAIDAGLASTGGAVFLTNFGIIEGASSAYRGGSFTDVIENFGTMSSVGTGAGGDFVTNGGLINSFILLSSGDDTYEGRNGRVAGYVDGGTDNDTLSGGDLTDDLRGGTGNDILSGRGGDDILTGSNDDDTLLGGRGDDLLIGGIGLDVLTGGADADVFKFSSAAEISSGTDRDRITDFKHLTDTIDLSAFPDWLFIGGAAFSGVAGQLRYAAGPGVLSGDLDGDGTADFSLILDGKPALTAADLIL